MVKESPSLKTVLHTTHSVQSEAGGLGGEGHQGRYLKQKLINHGIMSFTVLLKVTESCQWIHFKLNKYKTKQLLTSKKSPKMRIGENNYWICQASTPAASLLKRPSTLSSDYTTFLQWLTLLLSIKTNSNFLYSSKIPMPLPLKYNSSDSTEKIKVTTWGW